MGKTALAVNMTLRAAKYFLKEQKEGEDNKVKSVGFFSLEMSAEQLASRILAIETKIDGAKIRIGKVFQNKVLFKMFLNT